MSQGDAYLRVSSGGVWTRMSTTATAHDSVVFVDIDDPEANVASLITAFQELPFRLDRCRHLLLRWPQVSATTNPEEELRLDDEAQQWADQLAERRRAVGIYPQRVGVVRFRVGAAPSVRWNAEEPEAGGDGATALEGVATSEVLARARQVELHTLLLAGHGIWRPTSYHYELPSGDHSGIFVRVGDAFRNPRDVRAIASWLASRLRDGVAFAADSATVVPLITDLIALTAARGWMAGRAEMLDEYPRTRLDLMRVVRPLLAAPAVIALLTVSSSGSYRDLMVDALARASIDPDSWSLSVLIDKSDVARSRTFRADADGQDEERVDTWSSIQDGPLDPVAASRCRLCRDGTRAQVVKIDPRSFEALALPGVRLLMPDVAAARRSLGWWQACFEHAAIGVEVEPGRGAAFVSRPKADLLGVRFHLRDVLRADLAPALSRRLKEMRSGTGVGSLLDDHREVDFAGCDGVVVSSEEVDDQLSNPAFDLLLSELGLAATPRVGVTPGHQLPEDVVSWRRPLILSAGSITGWTMRQQLLALQERWRGQRDRTPFGLIVHARPLTAREWHNLTQSFLGNVVALWRTYLPWRSPIAEERRHLTEVGAETNTLTSPEKAFLDERRHYTRPRVRNWADRLAEFEADTTLPDPRSLLWGSGRRGGNTHVRNQSLYGYQVDAVTAYAAVGAAMHAARQAVERDDPRQAVFEMPAISRSYYDAIIVGSVLRWAEPQECWWGASPEESRSVVSELLARTTDQGDLKILLPELLLAASQGKIPAFAAQEVLEQAPILADQWDDEQRAPVGVGVHLLNRSVTGLSSTPRR